MRNFLKFCLVDSAGNDMYFGSLKGAGEHIVEEVGHSFLNESWEDRDDVISLHIYEGNTELCIFDPEQTRKFFLSML